MLDKVKADQAEELRREAQKRDGGVRMASTGLPDLDVALGGGYPRGRVVQLFGRDPGVLVRVALEGAKGQRKPIAWFDCTQRGSHAVARAEAVGLDASSLLVSRPKAMDELLHLLRQSLNVSEAGFYVVDHAEDLDGSERMMSNVMRHLVAVRHGAVILFLSSPSTDVRRPASAWWSLESEADPEVYGGGNALKFYATARVEIRPPVDGVSVAKVVKNKLAPPFTTARLIWSDR